MNFLPKASVAVALYSFVAMASSIPQQRDEVNGQIAETGLESKIRSLRKRATQNTENTDRVENIFPAMDMNINSEELSENFRCAVCLIECSSVQNPMRYFLCKACIESCSTRTDAFMHFFTSHECKVLPRNSDGGVATEEENTSEEGEDSRDTTSHAKRSTDDAGNSACDCSSKHKDYDELESKYHRCNVDLGNCINGWPVEITKYTSVHSGQPQDLGEDDYPETSPDRERSNAPPTILPSETTPDFKSISNTTQTNSDLDLDLSEEEKDKLQKVIQSNKALFMSAEEYESISAEKWEKSKKKFTGQEDVEEGERKVEACATKYMIKTPYKEPHRSGKFSVQIVQDKDWRQPFLYAECANARPVLHDLRKLKNAECRTVPVQRVALMIVKEEHMEGFGNCESIGRGRHVCREWINVPGACSLFL